MARAQGYLCHALSFDYGQRHRSELLAADRVATHLSAASHRTFAIDLRQFGGSALTDDAIDVPTLLERRYQKYRDMGPYATASASS